MKINIEKSPSVYDIYKRHSEEVFYPEMLVKAIINPDVLEFELTKAQILFDQWVDDYFLMNELNRNKFRQSVKKCLKDLKSVHTLNRTPNRMGIIYFLHYNIWSDLTKNIQNGLSRHNYSELNLLWKICFAHISTFKKTS